jgi:phosphomannomutase
VARYVNAVGRDAWKGRTVGVYSPATVGRDILMDVLCGCGAEVIELGRSDVFIPVDTEAVDVGTRAQLKTWAAAHSLDAIMSMDGDGDRPLLTDADGVVIPGDVLGQITGAWLGAKVAVTPVSSNTGAEDLFGQVVRTKIGSPYVIAGMEEVGGDVVGYEANGGFLLGFAAKGLSPLMTRDSVLPLLAPLIAATQGLSALVADGPARFTAADRLQEVPTERSLALVADLRGDAEKRAAFLAGFGSDAVVVDETDGLRMTLVNGRIVHLRPSGNAPECRFYAEAGSVAEAEATLALGLELLRKALG